jgi:hypothetical protein
MVDHEMFAVHGDIYKMILGSFKSEYDGLDEDDFEESSATPSIVNSPTNGNAQPEPSRRPSLFRIPSSSRSDSGEKAAARAENEAPLKRLSSTRHSKVF